MHDHAQIKFTDGIRRANEDINTLLWQWLSTEHVHLWKGCGQGYGQKTCEHLTPCTYKVDNSSEASSYATLLTPVCTHAFIIVLVIHYMNRLCYRTHEAGDKFGI